MYQYQTQELIKSGFDFSSVFPDKQKSLTEMSGFDFTLSDIVQYLEKESKNFKEHSALLDDVDRTILIAVDAWKKESGQAEPEPMPTPEPAASPEEKKKKMQSRVNLLKVMQKKKPSAAQAMRIKLLEKMLSK